MKLAASVSNDVDRTGRLSDGGTMTDTITSTSDPDGTAPDPALIEAFGEQLLGAATTATVAFGHKTGLTA